MSYGNSSGYIYPYENSYDYTGYGNGNTGRAISLNAAGDRIAIGGLYNSGGGYRSGFIRVYELNSSNTWAKVGSDYDGDGSSHYLGHAVSMNAKGDKFIGGAYFANSQRGYAKVFESNEFCATPLTITIHDGVFSTFSYSEGSYCTADNDPTPTISGTSGGTFSSTTGLDINASTGEIDLSESSEGRYTVTYIVSNTNCADTTTQDVWITESTIGFGYGTTVFCINTDDPTPTITAPAGGTFTASSGLIVDSTSGVIDLTNSPVGVYDVLYLSLIHI